MVSAPAANREIRQSQNKHGYHYLRTPYLIGFNVASIYTRLLNKPQRYGNFASFFIKNAFYSIKYRYQSYLCGGIFAISFQIYKKI
ncbi:MAG: hypothetical protein RI894_1166 [Bacteroidota bacterium]|jgi:hypothetical protein